ncbi:MAG: AMP-binding protein [Cyanobacteria bacterium J06627_3]
MGCTYGHTPVLHQWSSHGWKAYTYEEFRTAIEEFALGLKSQRLGHDDNVTKLERIGLALDSDIYWALTDMGSLLAGLVTVPIDRGQPLDTIGWIVSDANLQALAVPNWKTLQRLGDHIQQIQLIVMLEESPPPVWAGSKLDGVVIKTLTDIQHQGRCNHSLKMIQALKKAIDPDGVATIVYTSDAQGTVKGVMLSHKSLTGNIWAAFSSMPGLKRGTPEVALSFLPLNHIFARTFLYGHFGFGHDIYFTSPKRVFRHLSAVKPTIFITVPRLLEKVYERINSLRQQSSGLKHHWLNWGWRLAHHYDFSGGHLFGHRLQRWLLRHGMFGNLRRMFGGNIRYLLCGGAALRPEIMTFFNGVGIPVKQGYGLTETSSVLSYTRDCWLRSGTVGAPIPGVEMRLAVDGEVLVKSAYTMEGYHHNPEATDEVIDSDGWFHTGDLGEFSSDGLLTLHGCKKGLFKLSTGKYVAPGPIEKKLENSPLIRQALLVGPGQKFCGVLIVPEIESFRTSIQPTLMLSPYQTLIDHVNTQLPYWSTIKRFALIQTQVNAEVSRNHRYQIYAQAIAELYREPEPMPQIQASRVSRLGRRRLKALSHRERQTNIA